MSTMYILIFMVMMFVITNHPLTMGLSLMLTSLVMGLIIAFTGPSSWVAYMLVMIFVSGMMIIILYMSSLSSNESIPPTNFMKKVYASLLVIGCLLTSNKGMSLSFISEQKYFSNSLFNIIYKTYTQLMNPMTTLIIFYLLVVLIMAVSMVKVSKAPLRDLGE